MAELSTALEAIPGDGAAARFDGMLPETVVSLVLHGGAPRAASVPA